MKNKILLLFTALIVILFLLLTLKASAKVTSYFIDTIKTSKQHSEAIINNVDRNLIVGFEDGTFRPEEPMIRQDISLIFERLFKDYINKLFGNDIDLAKEDEVINEKINEINLVLNNLAKELGNISSELDELKENSAIYSNNVQEYTIIGLSKDSIKNN